MSVENETIYGGFKSLGVSPSDVASSESPEGVYQTISELEAGSEYDAGVFVFIANAAGQAPLIFVLHIVKENGLLSVFIFFPRSVVELLKFPLKTDEL